MLRDGPLTTGDLSAAFPELSRFAVMQHLGVLKEANLVIVQRQGRQRFNYLNAVPIREIYERWVSRYAGHWASALIGLKRALEHPESGGAVGSAERPRGTSATGAGSKAPASKKRIPRASARSPKGRARRSSSRKESDS